MIEELLDVPHDHLLLLSRSHPTKQVHGCNLKLIGCDRAVCGSIMMSLTSLELYPRPQSKSVSTSVEQLVANLRSVDHDLIKVYQYSKSEGGYDRAGYAAYVRSGYDKAYHDFSYNKLRLSIDAVVRSFERDYEAPYGENGDMKVESN